MKYLLIALSLVSFSGYAQEAIGSKPQSKLKFDGFYFGFNAGVQNVFGGSFVNEMDVLAQEYKFVAEQAVGYRKQLIKNRLAIGLEFSIGFLDGRLNHTDLEEDLKIDYQTSFQYSLGLIIGGVIGEKRNTLLFAYANETKRSFDVNIRQRQYSFQQTDKQGMLKYGIGVEWYGCKPFNIRGTFGALNVDFGELRTNIDVEDKFDFAIGVVYQF